MRAAIYVRVSSERQAAEDRVSIEVQLAECEEYCRQRGYLVAARYVDKEKYRVKGKLVQPSGQRKDRPQYVAMLKAADRGEFDVIVAWKEDRLYRGMYAAMPLSEMLDEKGKRLDVELVKETFDRKLLGIKAALGKIEADNIRERMMMGRRARLERGEVPGGDQVRYGYKKVDHHLETEEKEAGVIRQIFEWYCTRETNMQIRRRLNARSIPPRKGQLWAKPTIETILTTEAYATGLLSTTLDGETFYIPCPPIISMATWEKAQEIRAANRYLPRNVKKDYLCAGLVYCGCGWKCQTASVQANRAKGYDTPSGVYRCPRKGNKPETVPDHCVLEIGSKKVDVYVWNYIKKICSHPDILRRGINEKIITLKAEQGDLEAEMERLQKQLDELGAERQWVITQGRKKIITQQDMELQLIGLNLQGLGLQKELNEVKEKAGVQVQAQVLGEWAEQYLSEVGEGIRALDAKLERLAPEEYQALIVELEAWRFAERFPDDELAQLRWAMLEEKRRTVRMLVDRVIVSRTGGPEKRKITVVLNLTVPESSVSGHQSPEFYDSLFGGKKKVKLLIASDEFVIEST